MVSRCKIISLIIQFTNTANLGMSPYEMVINQKPRKLIMLTANAHKNAQGH